MIVGDALMSSAPHQMEPASGEALAVALKSASESRLQTVIRGGGTKMAWGRIPAAVDAVISTRQLNRVVAHRHGDLTGTFQAGARLRDVNAALAAHRQWLPLESAFDAATIGGIVATNDAGPLRHRYGTSRDLLIGVTLALTDGRVVKAGGNVVKNVAGYDLGRLMSGSFGTLAAIVDATFKLSPVWPTSQTVTSEFSDAASLDRAVQAVRGSQLEPVACDVHAAIDGQRSRYWLLVRFATSPAATVAQVDAARGLLQNTSSTVSGDEEEALWRAQLDDVWQGDGTVVRVGWLAADVRQAIDVFVQARAASGATFEIAARAGIGSGLLRIEGSEVAQVKTIEQLRASRSIGNVTVLRASDAIKQQIDVWPPAGDSVRVARALKDSLDPAGILNAGRGPV